MYKKIKTFDLKLKILFRFYIETKTSNNFMYRFDIKTESSVFLALLCGKEKQNSNVQQNCKG
jgi:hypothetical protein